MFRVVLDSNVLARAVMSPNGLAADLLKRLVQSENQLCTSDFMLSELVRVLSYPRLQKRHKLDDQMIANLVRSIQQLSIVIEVKVQSAPQVTRDVNDDPVVETAIRSSSKYLCTLDKDILATEVMRYCESHGVTVLNDLALLNTLRDAD
jgi:putative PIN family toxin of toxin-antitoxin system